MVVTQAVASTLLGLFSQKIIKKLDEIKPKDVQVVKIKTEPNEYSMTELVTVNTQNRKWTTEDNPILEIKNPLKKESIIREINIIPNITFKQSGKLLVTVDNVTIFKSHNFSDFNQIKELKLRVNKTVAQDSKVKFFLISNNGIEITLTIIITFGEY